jgi:hypothetical protein
VCRSSEFFANLRNKTDGIAALFQGCSDEKAVKKAPTLCRRAFRNTLWSDFVKRQARRGTFRKTLYKKTRTLSQSSDAGK